LVIGDWSLVIGHSAFRFPLLPNPPAYGKRLATGHWSLVLGHWSFTVRLSAFGFPLSAFAQTAG